MKVINVLAALAIVGISTVEAADASQQDVAMRGRRPFNPASLFGTHAQSEAMRIQYTQLVEEVSKQHHVHKAMIRMTEVTVAYTRGVLIFDKVRGLLEYIKEHTDKKFHLILELLEKLVNHLEDEVEIYSYSSVVLLRVGHAVYLSYFHASVVVDEPEPIENFLEWLASEINEIRDFIKTIVELRTILHFIDEVVRKIFKALAAYFKATHWRPGSSDFEDMSTFCPDCDREYITYQDIVNSENKASGDWQASAKGKWSRYDAEQSKINALALEKDAAKIQEGVALLNRLDDTAAQALIVEGWLNGSSSSSSSSDDSDDSDDDDDQAATKNDDDDQAPTIIV